MGDLDHQNFATVQSDKNLQPVTMAAAATIAVSTKMTRLTGVVPVTTITPPVTGYHELTFIFTTGGTAGAFGTGGNIAVAYTSVADRPITLHYDPRTKLYYPATVA